MPSFAVPAPLARSCLMRASDALATQIATYAIPLLILVTTRSNSLTGAAFVLEWLPRLVAFTLGGPLVDRFRAHRVFLGAHASRRAGSDAHRVQSVQIGIDQSPLLASNLALAVTQASAPITVMTSYGHSSIAVGAVWSTAGLVALAAVAACRRAIDRFGLWPVGAAGATTGCAVCLATALAPNLAVYAVTIGALMAGEGALTVILRTLRVRLIPAAVFGSTLSVTIVLVVVPMPVAGALVAVLPAGALPGLLVACAVLQGAAMALAFRGLWHHRASYTPSPTAADPAAAAHPIPAAASAPRAA
ncbi:hypothetical protein ABZ379_06895 [Streptomyces canus]|uniref:hypothetical protein n=1 Tax=Streptomyces canus TaxID=58343 RepID=UPI0033F35D10